MKRGVALGLVFVLSLEWSGCATLNAPLMDSCRGSDGRFAVCPSGGGGVDGLLVDLGIAGARADRGHLLPRHPQLVDTVDHGARPAGARPAARQRHASVSCAEWRRVRLRGGPTVRGGSGVRRCAGQAAAALLLRPHRAGSRHHRDVVCGSRAGQHAELTPGAPRPLLRRRVRGCSDGVNPHAAHLFPSAPPVPSVPVVASAIHPQPVCCDVAASS